MTSRIARTLDHERFERLLAFLHPDRDEAAIKYESLRRRLVKLFEWRGCPDSDECADDTIDRVARRVAEGAAITVGDPYQYFHGVALNVLRERWRDPARASVPLDEGTGQLFSAPEVDREADRAARERQLTCLESCLTQLVPAQRDLLLDYHTGSRLIARRQTLAQELGIPLNALRIRVHRIRSTVERCVETCVAERATS